MKDVKIRKIISMVLCAVLLFQIAPVLSARAADGGSEDLRLATLSDIRYFPDSLAGDKGDAYYTYTEGLGLVSDDQDAIIDAALDGLRYEAMHNGLKYAVICGDITAGGEYEAARAFAGKLKTFTGETGVKVFVINGDRDINNPDASDFSSNLRKDAKNITPAEFSELFSEFGFGDAYHTYKAYGAGTQGALTYSVKLDEGYRLILADCGLYTADCTLAHIDEAERAGAFSDEQLQWVLDEAADAVGSGETPLLFTHWNVSAMNDIHEYILTDCMLANSYKIKDMLADAGIFCTFSGHVNASDVSVEHSDYGAPLYSVITPPLTQYPFAYRVTDFDFGFDGSADISFEQHECDEIVDVLSPGGNPYPSPYRTIGFGKQFGRHADPAGYLNMLVRKTLSELVREISECGSVLTYIEKETGVNIEDAVNSFIGRGLKLDSTVILSSANILSFLSDLDRQLMNAYVYNPNVLYDAAEKAVKKTAAVKVSDVPCSKYCDEYGFGSKTESGTLGEFILDLVTSVKRGNETFTDDPFILDMLEVCKTPEFVGLLIDTLKENFINDILIDEILAKTEFRVSSFFVDHAVSVSAYVQIFASMAIAAIASKMLSTGGDADAWTSLAYMLTGSRIVTVDTVIDAVLGSGEGTLGSNTDEFVDELLGRIFGEEQKTAIAAGFGRLLSSLCGDRSPDHGQTVSYRGREKIFPTDEDMRLPSMVHLSANSSTSFTVTWYTKYSVTGTDIELIKDGGVFTGNPTKAAGVIAYDTVKETFDGYGLDCGTFGFMLYSRNVVKHMITVRNLVAGTPFRFRIGDAEKDFWKEGAFTTGSGTGAFTFLSVSDTDALTSADTQTFGNTLRTAENYFGALSFIVHGGDLLRNPKNDGMWKNVLDGNDDLFTDIPFMYTPGSNDANGLYSGKKHMTYSRTPVQYEEDGTYYSFDYGPAHFAVLNMNAVNADGTLISAQLKWLASDLAASTAGWKILVLHSAVFGVGDVAPALLMQLRGIADLYKVDLVLQGGTKAYMRSDLLIGGSATGVYDLSEETINGRTYSIYNETSGYIALSCGGGKTEFVPGNSLLVKNEHYDSPVISAVTVTGDTLCISSCTVDANGVLTEIDSFGLHKETVSYYLGDTDMDGDITSADARLALRIAVALDNVTPITKAAADVDGDVRIMPSDARVILRMSVGLENSEPVLVTKFRYEIAAYKDA